MRLYGTLSVAAFVALGAGACGSNNSSNSGGGGAPPGGPGGASAAGGSPSSGLAGSGTSGGSSSGGSTGLGGNANSGQAGIGTGGVAGAGTGGVAGAGTGGVAGPGMGAAGAGGGVVDTHGHYDWLQFCGDSQHSCVNDRETTLTAANVQGLKKLFSVPLTNATDGQPAYLASVTTPMGVKDMLYVLTSLGKLVAMDAYTGATVWSKTYTGSSYLVASPAIDPDRHFIYTYGLDGKVHKLQVEDGTEILTGGWPELSTAINGMRGYSLTIATAKDGNKYLYSNVTYYGGSPGSITIINLTTGTQHVFNGTCSSYDGHFGLPGAPTCGDAGGNSWSRAGIVYHPDLDRVYLSTGNDGGKGFNLNLFDWTGSIVALRPDGTTNQGMPLDNYTSAKYNKECFSVAPTIIPTLPGSKYKYLGLQGEKGSRLRFINMEDLSGQGGPGHLAPDIGTLSNVSAGGVIYGRPVVWTNPADKTVWAFVGSENGLSALQIGVDASGIPTMTSKWTHKTSLTTTATIANGVLYAADGGGQARFWAGDDHGIHKIYAMNPLTGAELWSDEIDFHHWSSPVIANGVLYIGDGKTGEGGAAQANVGTMTAFSLSGVKP